MHSSHLPYYVVCVHKYAEKIYFYNFLEWVKKPTQRKHSMSNSLFLTVQQLRQLRLTSPPSLKNVCLASVWTRNYHLTGDKFYYHSKAVIFVRSL